MTVSATTSRWEYDGDGATTAFGYGNVIFAATDLKVYVGVPRVLKTLNTHYTVSGIGSVDGGAVEFLSPPAAGEDNVLILRDVPATQDVKFPEGNSIPSGALSKGLDKLTVLAQQLIDALGRTIRLSPDSAFAGSLILPEAVAGKAIGWNAAADGLTNDPADFAATVAAVSAGAAAAAASAATASGEADTATVQASAAAASRAAADADAAATAADRAQVAADKAGVATDTAAAHADRLAADADAAATTADRAAVAADKAAVAADKATVAADKATTQGYRDAAAASAIAGAASQAAAHDSELAAAASAVSAAASAAVAEAAANIQTFKVISVAGQSDVVADQAGDTLTLAAGSHIAITTNAGADTVTVSVAGLGTAAARDADTDGTLSANSDAHLATQKAVKAYVDAHASTATDTLTAGEAVDVSGGPRLVYKDEFNQRGGGADRWWLVDSDATGPVKISPTVALATTSAAGAGNTFTGVVRPAKVSGFTGLTSGAPVWAHSTAGTLTQTAPAVPSSGAQNAVRLVGYASSATEVEFQPHRDTVFQARNSALAAGSSVTLEHYTDGGARERVARAYIAVPLTAQVSQGTGTAIGTMTGGGGLAVAFDGNVSQPAAGGVACSSAAANVGYIGKDWGLGTPKSIIGFKVWGTNDRGYDQTTNNYTVTLTLLGSNTNDPTAATVLYTAATFSDDNTTQPKDYSSALTSASSYRYHWVKVSHNSGGGDTVGISEVQFFEASGSRDEPVTTGSDTINSAATDRVTVKFADASDANQDTKTTFINRTGAARDLIVEVTL